MKKSENKKELTTKQLLRIGLFIVLFVVIFWGWGSASTSGLAQKYITEDFLSIGSLVFGLFSIWLGYYYVTWSREKMKNKEDEIDLDGLDFFKTMRIIRGWTILIMGVALIAFSTITFLNIL
jgi:hypothetical protein